MMSNTYNTGVVEIFPVMVSVECHMIYASYEVLPTVTVELCNQIVLLRAAIYEYAGNNNS